MAETAESVVIAIEAQMDTAALTQGTRVYNDSMAQITRSATAVEQAANRAFSSIATAAMTAAGPVQQFTAADLQLAQSLGQLAQQLTATAQHYRTITAEELAAAQAVAGFARATGTAASEVVGHNTRMGSSGLILQHVIRASADQFAAGAPIATIFGQHIAMVGEAAALSGSAMGRFGAFMAGPWGLAVTAGIALLSGLIAGHRSAADEAHKHETAEQTLMRALAGEADAVAKVTEALHSLREASDQAIDVDGQRILRSHALAAQELATSVAIRERLRAQLEAARQEAIASGAQANDPTLAGEGGFNPGSAQGALAGGRVSDLTRQIEEQDQRIADANRIIADTTAQMARNLATAVGRVNEQFDERRAHLEHEARLATAAARTDADRARIAQNLQRAEAALNVQRERAVRAATALDDAANGVTHRGPGEDVVDRADLLATARQHLGQTEGGSTASLQQFFRSAGININPTQMAWCAAFVASVLAANGLPVARGPDGSAALGARGYLNYGSATTHPEAGDIVVLRDQNRRRNSPEHGHVGFFEGFDANGRVRVLGGNQGRGGGVTETSFGRSEVLAYRRAPTAAEAQTNEERAARQAAELADHRARDEERFQNQLAGLNTELLNARRQQVQTEEQAAEADIAAINAQRDQRDERIRAEAADRTRRDTSQAVAANIEAGFLLAKSEELAAAQRTNRLAMRDQRLGEQRITTAIAELNNAESVEQARGALARTVAERRESELRLLDYQHREELLAIEKLRLQQGLTAAQRRELDNREATANTRYGLAQQSVRQRNLSPFDAYFDRIPQGAAEMNEALQEVAVDGLQQLNTGLGEAASRFLHLGGVAGHVLDAILNDLIQIVLRQAELAASGKGGGWSGFLSNIGQLVGMGSGGGNVALGDTWNGMPTFATGGAFRVNGGVDREVLSINGQARAMVSGDETIAVIPQGKRLSFGGARAASSAPQITVVSAPQFDLRGMIGTDKLFREVERVSQAHAVRAAAAMGQGVIKAMPARLQQLQTDGM